MSGNQEDSDFINELFGEMDADNDGRITAKELFQGMSYHHIIFCVILLSALSKNKDKFNSIHVSAIYHWGQRPSSSSECLYSPFWVF